MCCCKQGQGRTGKYFHNMLLKNGPDRMALTIKGCVNVILYGSCVTYAIYRFASGDQVRSNSGSPSRDSGR